MTRIQKFFSRILPRKWAEEMRAHSEAWRIRCLTCDASRSIWEAGGIRWRAHSTGKRTLVRCTRCGGVRAAAVEKAAKA